jgi:hypothetical protein
VLNESVAYATRLPSSVTSEPISFAAFYLARQLGCEVQCASRTMYYSDPIIRQLTASVHISHSVLRPCNCKFYCTVNGHLLILYQLQI